MRAIGDGPPGYTGGFGFTRPDWVMCGAAMPTGWVRLIASKELRQAELEAKFEYVRGHSPYWIDGDIGGIPLMTSAKVTLTVEFRSEKPHFLIIIDAPDYPAAFAELFRVWSPAPDVREAIGEGPREIMP